MTKPKLEAKLLDVINHYKRLYESLEQADILIRKDKLDRAHDFLNISMYRIEQIQIELEKTLTEIELQRRINNKHDTGYHQE